MQQMLKPCLWLLPCSAAAAAAASALAPAVVLADQHPAAQTGYAAGNMLPHVESSQPTAALAAPAQPTSKAATCMDDGLL